MKLKDIIIKNKYKLLTIIGILLTFSILLAISYAFFGRVIENTNTNAISEINTSYYTFTATGDINISLTLNEELLGVESANNTVPAFTSNGGNLNLNLTTLNSTKDISCTYDIVYEPVDALNSSNNINEFTIAGESTSGLSFNETNIVGSDPVTLISNASIITNAASSLTTLDSWNFTINFYNLNAIQDYIIGTNISGNIKLENINCGFNSNLEYGYETILTQNGGKISIEAKGTPDFTTVETGVVEMYAAEDDFGTSYYFRGKVNNNWVKFGKYTSDVYYNSSGSLNSTCSDGVCTQIAAAGDDMYWRIIRINGDNSIRMVYAGVYAPDKNTQYVISDVYIKPNNVGSTAFNNSYNDAEHVGYMNTEGQQRGISTNSTIKTYLDNWYTYTNLSTYYQNSSTDLIADQINCNDRNTSSSWASTGSEVVYAAYDRLLASTPSLKCTTKADRFTVNDTINGNGALSNPVGLLTADEVLIAGFSASGENTNCYLYNTLAYWLESPSVYDPKSLYAYVYALSPSGINFLPVQDSSAVLPVISLSSNVKLSGSGTYDDVYVVVE